MHDAKVKAQSAKEGVSDKFNTLIDATKAGVESFKNEVNNPSNAGL